MRVTQERIKTHCYPVKDVAGCDDDYCNRLRAATCRCGHVGAECFNDSYCDEPKVGKVTFEGDGTTFNHYYVEIGIDDYRKAVKAARHFEELFVNAKAEIEALKHTRVPNETADYWRKAFIERGDQATRAEIALQNRVTELEIGTVARCSYDAVLEQMDRLGQIINDLQADYAEDCVTWSDIFNARNEFHNTTELEQENRIEELSITIRVLSGMINNE
jgi:hypothetical protein